MAVSSTTNTGSATSMIDVSAIVDQLMQVENKPLDRLVSKIDQQKLVISDLGTIKSKVAAFQDALTDFENPLSFSTVNASSSNNAVLTASGSTGAALGGFAIDVTQTAQSSGYSIDQFEDTSALLDLSDFTLSVAGKNYDWSGGTATISSLAKWINSLGANVSARVIQTDSTSNYALQIYGTKTGASNAVTFVGLKFGETTYASSDEEIQTGVAQDSEFTLNGVNYVRSTNTITGVIDGVSLNLVSEGVTKVTVTRGADNSEVIIKKLIESYNDLITTYKSMTANAFNSDKPGNFANNPTMLSFVNEIKARFSQGISYGTDYEETKSLSWMGIDLQRDGTLKFNDLTYFDAKAGDLQTILAQGVRAGFSSSTESATAKVTFNALNSGQSITINGLTFTANTNLTAAQVATAFANIANDGEPNDSVVGGTFGVGQTLDGWISGSSSNETLIFTSTTKKRVDTSLTASSSGKSPTITFSGSNDLNHFIDGLIGITGFSGSLADMLKSENTELSNLNDRQADLKDRLALVQNNLINQYSALNALLYQLSQTNNALTSALSAISNNSKN